MTEILTETTRGKRFCSGKPPYLLSLEVEATPKLGPGLERISSRLCPPLFDISTFRKGTRDKQKSPAQLSFIEEKKN
jgi:hypothetical protein